MSQPVTLGFDVGTSSSKGVLVTPTGEILAQAVVEHAVAQPGSGRFEMDPLIWWHEFVAVTRRLLSGHTVDVMAVGASGMGPCVAVTDEAGTPLRPAILYGIDTRATRQIETLNDRLGESAIVARGGSALTAQSAGPKIAWIAEHEPDVFHRARRLFMPASFLVHRLTGRYVLDHHSASQCSPLYDTRALDWYRPWADGIVGRIELPELLWAGDVAGALSGAAAAETALPPGIPVIAGTIDAWSEAVSAGAHNIGDLMLMYGSTMFLINTVADPVSAPPLWATVGAFAGTRNLAGGMASSGLITGWLRELSAGPDITTLIDEAASSGPGARGLLMLPYFAGERTPIADPAARGVIAGLTLQHTRGDLYRACLEATAFGVRHNIETMRAAGGRIDRVVAVGGGTRGGLWTQIVSDVTGLDQGIPRHTVGASLGAAYLAARALDDAVDIDKWNPVEEIVHPDPSLRTAYTERYVLYRELYPATRDVCHALAGSPSA